MKLAHSTFADMLVKADSRPSGFDYMRITLAVLITAYHSIRTTYGTDVDIALWQTELRGPLRLVLPMFFVLSGFLVAGSMERCRTLVSFLGLRAIRIYPALIAEVLISAFLIGSFYTELPLAAYFTDPQFLRYVGNVTGHISYWLPGVFLDVPEKGIVNAQLWTVPFELYCYILLSALTIIGLKKKRWIGPASLTMLVIAYWIFRSAKPEVNAGVANLSGWMLMFYFLGGVSAYQFRDRIPAHPLLFVASAALSLLLLDTKTHGEYLAIPTVVYLTAYLGLIDFKRSWFSRLADLSYGLYLYHWTLQQAFVALFPEAQSAWLTGAAGMTAGLGFAWFSWNVIERPALSLKTQVFRLEKVALELWAKLLRSLPPGLWNPRTVPILRRPNPDGGGGKA